MKLAVVFLLNEYADWEGAYISSILNNNENWNVKTASTEKEVISIGGFKTKVDYLINDIPKNLDLFIMIGGNSWNKEYDYLAKLVKNYLDNNKNVAAICGACDFLAKNGLLSGYKHTGNSVDLWNNYTNYINKTDFLEEQAVIDKNLVTANGTAPIEFTKLILEKVNFKNSTWIKENMYLYKFGFYEFIKKYKNPF